MPSTKIRDRDLIACIAYMKQHHEGQIRKVTNAPYYMHPLGVLELMEESPFFFATRDKMAALLHDIREDSPGFSWADVRKLWGNYVVGAVCLLSKGKLGETNNAIYFNMLRLAHPSVIAIKLLDRVQNTSDYNAISSVPWLKKYLLETTEHVLPLIQIMVQNGERVSGGFYELGVWIEDHLQSNLHGMQARIYDLEETARKKKNGKKAKKKGSTKKSANL